MSVWSGSSQCSQGSRLASWRVCCLLRPRAVLERTWEFERLELGRDLWVVLGAAARWA
ncbi:unnamed protein product [Gulo gulo]|uniref:Uncharacterized protein n=1 Tax=Gulo gulo TaxID=48420 RepID=A0A9X9LLC6_GULGU|nr:unnamed protein product [Gulo gulo]